MSSTTDASDGNGGTQTKPVAGSKTHHNLSIVYIDHELDKPIAESTSDVAGNSISGPNLTVVYIDHQLDGSVPSGASPGSDGSNLLTAHGPVIQNQQGLFRLPPELRTIIWEMLLPGRRLLGAKAWSATHRKAALGTYDRKNKECKWFFGVYDWDFQEYWVNNDVSLEVPILLQICAESRSVALQHGQFIFGRRDVQGDTGTWWNSDLDVLVFDFSWNIHYHSWALAGLRGLEHVKHLAIDEHQSFDVGFHAAFNKNYHVGVAYTINEAIAFSFYFDENDETRHYILEFFPHFDDLTIMFSNIRRCLSHQSEVGFVTPDFEEYSVTFRVGMSMRAAVKELRKYGALCMGREDMRTNADCFSTSLLDRRRGGLTEGPYLAFNDDFDLKDIEFQLVATLHLLTSPDDDAPF